MIRINQIKLDINHSESELQDKIASLLRIGIKDFDYELVKKSLDARKKNELCYIYSVNVTLKGMNEAASVKKLHNNNIMLTEPEIYINPKINISNDSRIGIVGSGPAGLFCGLFLARAGLKPVIFERGASVEERSRIVNDFWAGSGLCSNTNVQFGEGGAGTFSDGKLNTGVKDKSGRIRQVLKTFIEFGAPADILWQNKPHIGTDILKKIVANMRNEIIRLGGEVHFNSCVTDLIVSKDTIKGLRINDTTDYEFDYVVLAIGHSARDTFKMLCDRDVRMESKAFAIGMRVVHPQSFIDNYVYKTYNRGTLPAADYKVTARTAYNKGVYSFCMCPGGYVVNASSEEEMLCVNGMSYSDRNSPNANSAIVVTVDGNDFGNDIFDGLIFQRKLEGIAYRIGGGKIPCQLSGDFLGGRKSTSFGSVVPMTKGGSQFADLREIFPEIISESIIDGMKSFDKIIEGFNMEDAVFLGVESRTSSPIRIVRGDALESISIKRLYPCGEGAGYAGGITSAAVDGIKVYEAIVSASE